jgi:hypothetical protein
VASRLPSFHQHGVLFLRRQALRLVLHDSEGITVDVRFLLSGENISSGQEIELPCLTVKVGNQDRPSAQAPQVSPSFCLIYDRISLCNGIFGPFSIVLCHVHPPIKSSSWWPLLADRSFGWNPLRSLICSRPVWEELPMIFMSAFCETDPFGFHS